MVLFLSSEFNFFTSYNCSDGGEYNKCTSCNTNSTYRLNKIADAADPRTCPCETHYYDNGDILCQLCHIAWLFSFLYLLLVILVMVQTTTNA